MKKILAYIAAALVGISLTMSPVTASANDQVKNLKSCDGTFSGTYKNVTVQPGESCVLDSYSVVLGGVHAKPGAKDLFVHTDVARNIQAKGVTGTVMVGPEGCKYDPRVGNNIHVSDSHNVLICLASVGNNIMVTGNDGRITVRDSTADNNIKVDRNLAYVSDGPTGHRRAGAIRLIRLEAGGHVTTKGNDPSRKIIRRDVVAGH